MSKKKKHKKNKMSQAHADNKINQASVGANALGASESDVKPKLLTTDEELVKLENKPVEFLGQNKSTSDTEISASDEVSTLGMDFKAEAEKFDTGVLKQESKLKHDLEKETSVTLESEAEHLSHVNKSPNNFVPLLVGIILGGLLMSWWL